MSQSITNCLYVGLEDHDRRLGARLLQKPGVERKGHRISPDDASEIRMGRIEQVIEFDRNQRRRHSQDRARLRPNPFAPEPLERFLVRRSLPAIRQLPDLYRLNRKADGNCRGDGDEIRWSEIAIHMHEVFKHG